MTKQTFECAGARCPHCLYLHRPDGPFLYDEALDAMDCDVCEKAFKVRVYTSTNWTCTPMEHQE